jgi:hypothetical protein
MKPTLVPLCPPQIPDEGKVGEGAEGGGGGEEEEEEEEEDKEGKKTKKHKGVITGSTCIITRRNSK